MSRVTIKGITYDIRTGELRETTDEVEVYAPPVVYGIYREITLASGRKIRTLVKHLIDLTDDEIRELERLGFTVEKEG